MASDQIIHEGLAVHSLVKNIVFVYFVMDLKQYRKGLTYGVLYEVAQM